MADEVYERLYYREEIDAAPTILRKTTPDDAVIVVQSFSKAWCMTGWRLGWLIARPDLAARVTQLNEFIISHAASFTQKAAEVALAEGEQSVRDMVAHYRSNRDYCLQRIAEMPGLSVPEPEGAFYLFPRVEGLTDSFEFCKDLLLKTKVGLAPGVAFGAGGEGHIRICYASDRSVLEPAMDRLQRYLSERR
jgi:aspartate/methionine/tyrosine aminotransferase